MADPDEWADLREPESTGPFDSALLSPPVVIPAGKRLWLRFDSHYGNSATDQTALVTCSFGGAAEEVLLRYHKSSEADNGGANAFDQSVCLAVPVPETDSTAMFGFRLCNAGNSYFWAIDNVRLSDEAPPPTPTPLPSPTATPIAPRFPNVGPWVIMNEPGRATIAWWRPVGNGPYSVDLNPGRPDEKPFPAVRKGLQHEAAIQSLQPDTEYAYRLRTPNAPNREAAVYRFRTPPGPVVSGGHWDVDSLYSRDPLMPRYAETARRLLDAIGPPLDGRIVVVEAGVGRLARELARQSRLRVVAFESDARRVARARHALDLEGLYGVQVSFHQTPDGLPPESIRRFANLVVSDAAIMQQRLPAADARDLWPLVRPWGGVLCAGATDDGGFEEHWEWLAAALSG